MLPDFGGGVIGTLNLQWDEFNIVGNLAESSESIHLCDDQRFEPLSAGPYIAVND